MLMAYDGDLSDKCVACGAGTAPGKLDDQGNPVLSISGRGGALCVSCDAAGVPAWRANLDVPYCTRCPFGTYMPNAGFLGAFTEQLHLCSTECPDGQVMSPLYGSCNVPPTSVSATNLRLALCESGMIPDGAGGCTPCPPDTWTLAGGGKCIACLPGTTSIMGAAGCTAIEPALACEDSNKVSTIGVGSYDCFYRYIMYGDPNAVHEASDYYPWAGKTCHEMWKLVGGSADATTQFGLPLIRLCPEVPLDQSPNAAGQIGVLGVLAQSGIKNWGKDDSKGLEHVFTVMPYGFDVHWVKIVMVSGLGFMSYEEATTEAPTNKVDGAGGETGARAVYDAMYNEEEGFEKIPVSCSDPRATERGWCHVPVWAIFCPSSCGVIPSPTIMCDAPTMTPFNAVNNVGNMPSYYTDKPVRPPSMAECKDFGGEWNVATGQIEPVCHDTASPIASPIAAPSASPIMAPSKLPAGETCTKHEDCFSMMCSEVKVCSSTGSTDHERALLFAKHPEPMCHMEMKCAGSVIQEA